MRDRDPPTGEQLRDIIRYEHDRLGDLIHVDIKSWAHPVTLCTSRRSAA
ncbi:hypothetical protein ABZ027_27195 [Streptomyces sp. NPDC006332]